MEKNTILLSVETYNELRDFKKEIENGFTYRVKLGVWENSLTFIGTDKALEEMSQNLKTALEELEVANKEIKELKNPGKKQPSIDEIKAMNWWKFRKWRTGKL